MAGSSLFSNLARVAKVVTLLLFFLPWMAVSCSPQAMQQLQGSAGESAPASIRPNLEATPAITIATASGLNMALGSLKMANSAASMGAPDAPVAPGADRVPEIAPEIGVIAGAALILLGLALTFLKGTAGAAAGAGCSLLAAIAFCYSVFISYPPAVIAAFAAGSQGGSATPEQIGQVLSVKPEVGFYVVLLLLVLSIVFNVLAMRKPGGAPAAAVATPPPVEPPAAV